MCGRYSPALEQHHRPQQRLRVQHRRRDHVHRVLCEPKDAPRRAVRPPLCVRPLLGPDADMPLQLPRAGAAVGAAPHGLRALLVGVYKLVYTTVLVTVHSR
jgi:hypothetical protein